MVPAVKSLSHYTYCIIERIIYYIDLLRVLPPHILRFDYYLQIGNRQQLVFRFHIQVVWINDFNKPLSSVFVCFYCPKCVFNQFQRGSWAFVITNYQVLGILDEICSWWFIQNHNKSKKNQSSKYQFVSDWRAVWIFNQYYKNIFLCT